MIPIIQIVLSLASLHYPSSYDQNGWALRAHRFSASTPYISEVIDSFRFEIVLLNRSNQERHIDPLPISLSTGLLKLDIKQPNGEPVPRAARHPQNRDPFTQPMKIRPSESVSLEVQYSQFGYSGLGPPGRYRLHVSLMIGNETLSAPPIEFDVIAVPEAAVLQTIRVPLGDAEANRPDGAQFRPVVRQIAVRDRVLVMYNNRRIGELSVKSEITVEGMYGLGEPLVIMCQTISNEPPLRWVLDSITGHSWMYPTASKRTHPIPTPRPVLKP